MKPSPPVGCSTGPHTHIADLPAFHCLQVPAQDDSSSQRQGKLQFLCSLLLCAARLYAARLPSSHAPDTSTNRQALLPLLGLLLLAWILELVGLIFVHRCAQRPLTRVSICCARRTCYVRQAVQAPLVVIVKNACHYAALVCPWMRLTRCDITCDSLARLCRANLSWAVCFAGSAATMARVTGTRRPSCPSLSTVARSSGARCFFLRAKRLLTASLLYYLVECLARSCQRVSLVLVCCRCCVIFLF